MLAKAPDWKSLRKEYARRAVLMKLFETNSSSNGELNPTVITNIIETYQTITTCKEIIDILKYRFNRARPNSNKITIEMLNLIRIVKAWFKTQPNASDEFELKQFIDYIGENSSESDGSDLFKSLLDIWTQYKENVENDHKKSLDNLVDKNFKGEIISIEDFLNKFTPRAIAEQLTQIDKELFESLQLYQCLGRFRSKNKKYNAESVDENVNQFNRVSYILITSILAEPGCLPSDRAYTISKWIEIAVQLRLLKNFTSLNAVISALSVTAIKRLEMSWNYVPRSQIGVYKEMRKLFSLEKNFTTLRELHTKEGTAKYPVLTQNETKLIKYAEKMNPRKNSCGTIPYLGVFLSDLEMLDKNPNDPSITDEGLINYDKIKRQADILLQLKYIQTTLGTYDLQDLRQDFVRFYKNQPVLTEKDAYDLSLKLEPPAKIQEIKRRRKSVQQNTINKTDLEFYNIRVFADKNCRVDTKECEIKLRPNDRPITVIINAIRELKLNGTPDKFDLIMVTERGHFEMQSNVYQAVNPKIENKFIIKLKKQYRPWWFEFGKFSNQPETA